MNETGLILRQIALEQQHASEVLALCRSRPEAALAAACIDYLRLIESRARARARAHARRLQELGVVRETEVAAAGPALTLPRNTSEINSEELATYTNNLMTHLESFAHLDTLAASHYALADWRAVSGLDADAILEEQRRYAAIATLTASRGRGSQ